MVHTFLSAGQIDELVALYVQGMTLPELGERFGVHHRTATAHLVRRTVPQRTRGLADEHVPEARNLYESGMTLTEIGLHLESARVQPVGRYRPRAGQPARAAAEADTNCEFARPAVRPGSPGRDLLGYPCLLARYPSKAVLSGWVVRPSRRRADSYMHVAPHGGTG